MCVAKRKYSLKNRTVIEMRLPNSPILKTLLDKLFSIRKKTKKKMVPQK